MAVEAEDQSGTPGVPAGAQAGVLGLLSIPAFRAVMAANVLSAIALGSSRFVYVWLVGELTEWNPATTILGIVIGLPPLLLSAWAGSLADRHAPRWLGLVLFSTVAISFAAVALLVVADLMTVVLAMVMGFLTTIAPSMLIPGIQALVPQVVPRDRLLQAVAIQNLGMMVSVIFGLFLGGAVIQAFGIAAGFWQLSIAGTLGALVYLRGAFPAALAGAGTERRGAIRAGARIAFGTEPLRSLLLLMAIVGIAIATVTLLLPEFARDVLGKRSLAASALNAFMSAGMVTTSMILATRWTPRRPGTVLAVISAIGLGGGLIAIGVSRAYAVTALCALLWGAGGGITMTLIRTLTQVHAPPELMGRVMGLSALAQNGMFPVTAIVLTGLVAATSVATTLVLAGVICTVLVWMLIARPDLRSL